jgi:hypothetical protein
VRELPNEIGESFLDCILHPWQWTKLSGGTQDSRSMYYSRQYVKGTDDWNRVIGIFSNYLAGGTIRVDSITALYNPTLTSSFINAWNVTSQRIKSSPHLFKMPRSDNQKAAKDPRQNILEKYNSLVRHFTWNDTLLLPIIPCCHGTGRLVAEKIAETGFAVLSSLDAGFYGKGIYFTSHALYAVSYCSSQALPALIISWIFPGNVYAVIESPTGPESLLGSSLKSGFNSHFVVTDSKGMPLIEFENRTCSDEIGMFSIPILFLFIYLFIYFILFYLFYFYLFYFYLFIFSDISTLYYLWICINA